MCQFISLVLLRIDSRSCHISATNSFDFFDGSKFLIVQDLIKIDNDFIQEANTFHTLIDIFGVKFGEVRNGGKKYSSGGTSVCIKLLRGNNIMRKIFNFVCQKIIKIGLKNLKFIHWPRRDSNTQPSDLESDALPLRHGVCCMKAEVNQFFINFSHRYISIRNLTLTLVFET